jgi:hypothetical protein
MSRQLIDRNADLRRLREAGYNIEVRAGFLIVRNIPYADSQRKLRTGILVSSLDLAGDDTISPRTHTVNFAGEYPCSEDGAPIESLRHQSVEVELLTGLKVQHSFSAKPKRGHYLDYFEKMSTYATLIASHATLIDPHATPLTKRIVEPEDDRSPFLYLDTASARAEINVITAKLALHKVAIVGIGGTGSYVLDLMAKTPVEEIHLFDGDEFSTHNAFRAPGAPSLEQLRKRPSKVAHFVAIYSNMRRGLIPHEYSIDEANVEQLRGMNFVFLSMGAGPVKGVVVSKLEEFDIPFIDVGMGLYVCDQSLNGIVRVTTSMPGRREGARKRIPVAAEDEPNEYDKNIQIADLNCLNAAMAVIKWKKYYGFYLDQEQEQYTSYTIGCNLLVSNDLP